MYRPASGSVCRVLLKRVKGDVQESKGPRGRGHIPGITLDKPAPSRCSKRPESTLCTVADRGLGRLNWADTDPTVSARAWERAKRR